MVITEETSEENKETILDPLDQIYIENNEEKPDFPEFILVPETLINVDIKKEKIDEAVPQLPEKTVEVCQLCKTVFESKQKYLDHLDVHMYKKCPICRKQIHLSEQKEHSKIHESLICELCGIKQENINILKIHMKKHLDQKEKMNQAMQCEVCGEKFRGPEQYDTHKRKFHTGFLKIKIYKSIVNFNFTGEPIALCDICGKIFFSAKSLGIHKKEFHNKKPHVCDCENCKSQLGDSNKRKGCLLLRRNKTQKFICEYCGKDFTQKGNWRIHLRTRHNFKEKITHTCEICNKGFASIAGLDLHMNKHRQSR